MPLLAVGKGTDIPEIVTLDVIQLFPLDTGMALWGGFKTGHNSVALGRMITY